jgi:hypothetical protein
MKNQFLQRCEELILFQLILCDWDLSDFVIVDAHDCESTSTGLRPVQDDNLESISDGVFHVGQHAISIRR